MGLLVSSSPASRGAYNQGNRTTETMAAGNRALDALVPSTSGPSWFDQVTSWDPYTPWEGIRDTLVGTSGNAAKGAGYLSLGILGYALGGAVVFAALAWSGVFTSIAKVIGQLVVI